MKHRDIIFVYIYNFIWHDVCLDVFLLIFLSIIIHMGLICLDRWSNIISSVQTKLLGMNLAFTSKRN